MADLVRNQIRIILEVRCYMTLPELYFSGNFLPLFKDAISERLMIMLSTNVPIFLVWKQLGLCLNRLLSFRQVESALRLSETQNLTNDSSMHLTCPWLEWEYLEWRRASIETWFPNWDEFIVILMYHGILVPCRVCSDSLATTNNYKKGAIDQARVNCLLVNPDFLLSSLGLDPK